MIIKIIFIIIGIFCLAFAAGCLIISLVWSQDTEIDFSYLTDKITLWLGDKENSSPLSYYNYSQRPTNFQPYYNPRIASPDWIREERNKMNRKYNGNDTLRNFILKRDNYTCCKCGISIYDEPHLLLEVDHIVPVSAGGPSIPQNLQTLCWQCNRAKSNK